MNLSRVITGELLTEAIEEASGIQANTRTGQGTFSEHDNERIELQLDSLSEDQSPNENEDNVGSEVVLMREIARSEEEQAHNETDTGAQGAALSSTASAIPNSPPEIEHQGVLPTASLNTFLIGNYSFVDNDTIKICGMKFRVNFKNLDEEAFRTICAPQIPYRIARPGQSSTNRIVKYGYDRRLPLIVCMAEEDKIFIVDGESRRAEFCKGLDSKELRIRGDRRSSRLFGGIRIEPQIPVVFLNNRITTRMERLAISVALNTATRLDQPLQLGDVVVSLGSFIKANYLTNGHELDLTELLSMVDQITTDIMGVQLLDQFMETNKEHSDIAKRWTLQNTSEDITTPDQIRLMNKFEDYKLYLKCAVGFLNCPAAYKLVFADSGDAPLLPNRFESQWTLSLFSHDKFISLDDDGKVLLLACLAMRQRLWGTAGVPFTTFQQTLTLIGLRSEIYKAASAAMNKEKLGKKQVLNNVFEKALLINHLDKEVREEPYVKSIFFFMVSWKPNVRRFSTRAIIKEVSKDISSWPSKRNWRSTECKDISMLTDIWSVISRDMHAAKKTSARRSSGRVRNSRVSTTDEDLSRNVVTSLDNNETFGKLINMGNEMGIEKAVKQFAKRATKRSGYQQQPQAMDRNEAEENRSSMEIEDPKVPLTQVVKWWFRDNKHKETRDIDSEGMESVPSDANEDYPLEYCTSLTTEEVEQVSQLVKSLSHSESVSKNLPKVFPKDGIWSHILPEHEVQEVREEYRDYVNYAMMEIEGVKIPDESDEASKEICGNVLFQCYKKICQEKLKSQGFLYFPNFYQEDGEVFVDKYLDHYRDQFDEKEIRRPWTSVKTGGEYDANGRYLMEFDSDTFSDLLLDEHLCHAKLHVEVKCGMVLDHVLGEKVMNVDKLGSHPVMHGENNNGAAPLYLHEIGRYGDSKRRRKFPDNPSYHLLITGKTGFRLRIRENSHFRNPLPWRNRNQLSKKFTKLMIPVRPYSMLLVHGNLLFNFPSSALDDKMFGTRTSACIRMMVHDQDYDDEEDDSYEAHSSDTESDSNKSAECDEDEVRRLKESTGMGMKKPKPGREGRKATKNISSSSSSEDEKSNSNETSSSDSSSDMEQSSPRNRSTGRKGLHLLRKTPESQAKLLDKIKPGKGNKRVEEKATIKRRNSRLEVRKGERGSSPAKKRPRKGS